MTRILLTFVLFFLVIAGARAQDGKAELERERAANQKEIEALKKQLDRASGEKKKSLSQLNAIQNKLRLRQQQISIINRQMSFIEGDINQSWREITKLKKELDTLKLQYEKSVVYAYKNRSNYDFINFIFSAVTFNDAIKRISYLKSYRAYREEQANNITRTQDLLQGKITGLKENQAKKTAVLKDENMEKKELENEKKQKDAIVSELKAREKEIAKELSNKKRNDLALAKAIRAVAEKAKRAAIAESKKKQDALAKTEVANKKANPTTNPGNNSTSVEKPKVEKTNGRTVSPLDADPEAKEMSDNFEKNRGSLPWPTSGAVSMRFGVQYVEGLDGIKIDNPGITMETGLGETVKVVFDGEVAAVINVANVQAVIIRHGKYFTTYSNLESVNISKGQQVKRGQVIGKVSEVDGRGSLEFLISNDVNKNFDPEKWLR
jgi:murein hydrolase activator